MTFLILSLNERSRVIKGGYFIKNQLMTGMIVVSKKFLIPCRKNVGI